MKRLYHLIIMATLALSMTAQGNDVVSFVNGLMEQYPKARLLDIYKSSFQDFMGAEHLVSDTASVRAYLEQELATTDVDELMPWYYEPCGAHGNYVRVSLRVVMEGKITVETLLNAFIASANCPTRPTVEDWATQWHDMMATIDKMGLELPHYDEDKAFIESVLEQGKYAISHSPDYREAYSPHYRIVERGIFEQEIKPALP